jgi:hypothetical protein
MGSILWNGCSKWERIEQENGSTAWAQKILKEGLTPSKELWKGLSFTKANRDFYCQACRKKKPKNTRYLLGRYDKVCTECAENWVNKSIESLNEMIKTLNQRKEELKRNKQDWRKQQILGALK